MRLFLLFSFFGLLLPKSFLLLDHGEFVVGYDTRTRNAAWVYQKLTRESVLPGRSHDRKRFFSMDPRIPFHLSACNRDYLGTGFDRGHLCPCGDLSEESIRSSFYLSNICPQHPQFNRGVWRRLERYIRSLVSEKQVVHVITLPLYLPEKTEDGRCYVNYQVLGKSRVAVPTHFAKAIFLEKEEGVEIFCYLLPNKEVKKDCSLNEFLISLHLLEKLSGVIMSEIELSFNDREEN